MDGTMTVTLFLLIGSILLFISVLLSKISARFGIPLLLLFMGVGMLAGSDGIGKIYLDNPVPVQFIGVVALNFILFSGGMETRKRDIVPVVKEGLTLATLGALFTAILVGVFTAWISDRFTLLEGLLLGAIISSTDAAATFMLFRTKSSNVKHNLRPVLELESGSNDPMAYFLTISFIYLIQHPEENITAMLTIFFKGMAIGGVIGFLMGKLIALVMQRAKLSVEGLYSVLVISLALFTYGIAEQIGGNGILAVYLAGIVVGNSNFSRKQSIVKFYNAITWLMQIVMFLLLGLLVFPSHIPAIMGIGLLISFFLMFVARPIAIYLSTFWVKRTFKDRLFIMWGGLRGASPIIFATYPMVAGIEHASDIFHIVFFVSCISVLFQGSSLIWVASKLRLIIPEKAVKNVMIDLTNGNTPIAQEVVLEPNAHVVGHSLKDLDIPQSTLVMLIERDGKAFIPNGSTILKSKDILYVISDDVDKTESFAVYLTELAKNG